MEACYQVDFTSLEEVDRPLVEQQTLVVLFQVAGHLAEFSTLVKQSWVVAGCLEDRWEVKKALVALACLGFEGPTTLVVDVG